MDIICIAFCFAARAWVSWTSLQQNCFVSVTAWPFRSFYKPSKLRPLPLCRLQRIVSVPRSTGHPVGSGVATGGPAQSRSSYPCQGLRKPSFRIRDRDGFHVNLLIRISPCGQQTAVLIHPGLRRALPRENRTASLQSWLTGCGNVYKARSPLAFVLGRLGWQREVNMPGSLRVMGEPGSLTSLPHPGHEFVVENRDFTIQLNPGMLDPSRPVLKLFLLGVVK